MAGLRNFLALTCLYGALVCGAGADAPPQPRKYGSIYEAMTSVPELAIFNRAFERLNKLGDFPEAATTTLKSATTAVTIFAPVRTPTNGPGLENVRELFAPGVKTDAELMSAIESKKDQLTPLLRNISAYTVVPNKAVATLTDGMRLQTRLSDKFLTIYKPAKGNDTFVIGVGGFGRVIGSPIQAGSSYIYTVDWPLLPYTYYTILTKIGAIKEEGASTAGMAPPSKGVETKSAQTGSSAGRRMMLSVDLMPGECWSFDQMGSETQRKALAQCQNACPKGTCEQRVQQKSSMMHRAGEKMSGKEEGITYCHKYSYSHPNWYSCISNSTKH